MIYRLNFQTISTVYLKHTKIKCKFNFRVTEILKNLKLLLFFCENKASCTAVWLVRFCHFCFTFSKFWKMIEKLRIIDVFFKFHILFRNFPDKWTNDFRVIALHCFFEKGIFKDFQFLKTFKCRYREKLTNLFNAKK